MLFGADTAITAQYMAANTFTFAVLIAHNW